MINPIKLLPDLAVELRVRVYEMSFSEYRFDDFVICIRCTPAILKVSRQLRLEGQQIFYSNKTWDISIRSFGELHAKISQWVIKTLRSLDQTNES